MKKRSNTVLKLWLFFFIVFSTNKENDLTIKMKKFLTAVFQNVPKTGELYIVHLKFLFRSTQVLISYNFFRVFRNTKGFRLKVLLQLIIDLMISILLNSSVIAFLYSKLHVLPICLHFSQTPLH